MTDRPKSDAHARDPVPGHVRHKADHIRAYDPSDPRKHSEAAARLSDTEYLVHALIQSFKLFLSLAAKRWPELR